MSIEEEEEEEEIEKAQENLALADKLFEMGQYNFAEQPYRDAVVMFSLYNVPEKACEAYYKIAQLQLKIGRFDAAFQECTESLRFYPTAKAYLLRAIVLQDALMLPFITVPPKIRPANVVADYCNSHRLEDNVSALTEAIIFAVDKNCNISHLKSPKNGPLLKERHVRNGFCTILLLSLLGHDRVKEAHIKLLVEMPIAGDPPHFDCSNLKISRLLQMKISHEKIMKCFSQCGMEVKEKDMKLAVETLPAENTAVLDSLCAHYKGDLEELLKVICPIALNKKKIRFVLYMLKKGCELPCTSQRALTLALQKDLMDVTESLLPFCKLSEVDLGQLMHICTELMNHQQLIAKMIDSGINPCGLGVEKPLVHAHKVKTLTKRLDLICLLLKSGCDCAQLCHGSQYSTTPIHAATTIGLEAGPNACTRVLDAVVKSPTFDVEACGDFVDGKGDTPLHLAINNQKRETSFKLVKALIETHKLPIDPSIRNHRGKRVTDGLGKSDRRRHLFAMATKRVHQGKRAKAKQKESEEPVEEKDTNPVTSTLIPGVKEAEKENDAEKESKRIEPYQLMSITEKLEMHLKMVLEKGSEYFVAVTEQKEEEGEHIVQQAETKETQFIATPETTGETRKKGASPHPSPVEEEDEEEGDMTTVMSTYGLEDFDDLPWEVEVTNNVLKFFKSEKEHPYKLRLRAARTVYELAEGKRGQELSKELSSQSSNLFEAKISKGGRIIWQRAVQFSPRRTGELSNPIYAQVIRIWEIVPNHNQLAQTIRYCVKQVELSNEKGLRASLNVCLIPQQEAKRKKKSVKNQETLEIPKIYTQADVNVSDTDIQRYTPAASPKEDEFNVTTFYSFSGAVLKSMLTGSNARRDFPFKEWPKEHEIINLPDRESILLLGRSGTGKTTCCLYRLWNEFRIYWDRPNIIMLPRKPLVTLKYSALREDEEDKEEELEPEDENITSEGGDDDMMPTTPVLNQAVENSPERYEEEAGEELPQVDNECDDMCTEASSPDNIVEGEPSGDINEHLHQVFVTKNYVLCAQMKRRFYDMAAAHEFLDTHMEWEARDIPHSFAEIDDYAYPLFLTARQFYILLDNSISDEQCFFRPREKDGSLKVKIVSTDYDHEDPDTLLDLEDSDSEEEDVPNAPDAIGLSVQKQPAQKYVEVTSLYFTEYIWPEISRRCGARHLDPMLVWIEIQSFIKGSRKALLRGSALPLNEYLDIGYKMAPNFADEREKIYALYKRYEEHCQNKRHIVFLFDECDLVHDIHRRLRAVHDLPWSVHSLYVDEVQDFTQAELALYLHCVRHPNSLFFTGDTAQSIMRGIAFRFQDLRSSFHAIHRVVPQVRVPQEPHTLTINFRSHSGILQLAGSIIDLLQMFFKGSIDHLPADAGMFLGPTPVILASCEESDLALLLSSNKRQSSRIEFGAHQVVLVQSKDAKDRLPTILKGAIVLTIFESKGLEFDDVLLYNFFQDSMVDEKGWRVVTAYLEEHEDKIKVNKQLPGSATVPRSNKFDEKSHKILNSELKYLYTAITRAKCNLWIYDSDQKRRLPMFDLWYKRDLVKVVGDNIKGVENQHSLIFASISNSHQWKVQGDYFMKRSRWEQAKHCYDRAGPENEFLSVEAHARFVVQQATRLTRPHMYLEAAVNFLHRDQLVHNVQCLVFSAQCLKRAKPQRNSPAAVLFERLGKYGEALKCYRKAKDIVNCIRLLEKEGCYDEAISMIRAPKDALAKAKEYTSKEIQLPQELLPENLAYTYAVQYARFKDKPMLLEVLKYIHDISRKGRFLKMGGFYSDAFEIYVSNNEEDDAYRLASGRCLFSEGKSLARKKKDVQKEAKFVFHQAHDFFIRRKEGEQLPQEIQSDLKALSLSGKDMLRAHALLLMGIVKRDAGLCRSSHKLFMVQNKVAALEAFNALTDLESDFKPPVSQVLEVCEVAKNVQHALRGASDLNLLVRQALAFYGLQKVRDVFLMPPNHNMWVSTELKLQCRVRNDKEKDVDGMIRLQVKATKDTLASHVGAFVQVWLEKYDIEAKITEKWHSSRLHGHMLKDQRELHGIPRGVAPTLLTEYIRSTVEYYRLGSLMNKQEMCDTATATLLSIFSPNVSLYLPVGRKHLNDLRAKPGILGPFTHVSSQRRNHMDDWFKAWRACVIVYGNTEYIDGELQRMEEPVNNLMEGIKPPPAFRFSGQEKCYFHIFNYWLYSCTLIRHGRSPVFAAQQAINIFASTVVRRKSLKIADMNLVNVLAIHAMSIFAMISRLNFQEKKQSIDFVVPVAYIDCVKLFDILNCHREDMYTLCTAEVRRAVYGQELKLRQDCFGLLNNTLGLLLGMNNRDINLSVQEKIHSGVLCHSFKNSSGTAQHCLALALTLFGNLIPHQPPKVNEMTRMMFDYFFDVVLEGNKDTANFPEEDKDSTGKDKEKEGATRLLKKKEEATRLLKEGKSIMKSSSPRILRPKLFEYVNSLLREGSTKGMHSMNFMKVSDKGTIKFTPLRDAPKPKPSQEGSNAAHVPSPGVESTRATTHTPGQGKKLQSSQAHSPKQSPHALPPQVSSAPHYSPHPSEQTIDTGLNSLREPYLQPPQTKWEDLSLSDRTASSQTVSSTQQSSVPPQIAWHAPSHSQSSLDQPQSTYRPSASIAPQASYSQSSSAHHSPFDGQAMQQPTHLMSTVAPPQPHGVLESHHTLEQPVVPVQQSAASSALPWPDFPTYQLPATDNTYPGYFPYDNAMPQQPTGHGGIPLEYSLFSMQYYDWPYPSLFTGDYTQSAEPALLSDAQFQQASMTQFPPGPPPQQAFYSPPYFASHAAGDPTQSAHQPNVTQMPSGLDAAYNIAGTAQTPDSTANMQPYVSMAGEQAGVRVPLTSDVQRVNEKRVESEFSSFGEKEPTVEEDEGTPGMSDFRKSNWPHVPTVESHLVDPSIVTDDCCNICGVALASKQMVEDGGETFSGEGGGGTEGGAELYDSHVRSNEHARSYAEHKRFWESYEGCYTGMVGELTDLMYTCEQTQAPPLTRLIDDMRDTLDKYERKMANRLEKLNWKMGLSDIDKATDDFQRLLSEGKRKYDKFVSENPTWIVSDHQGGEMDGDSDKEFQAEINKTMEDVGDDDLKLRNEEAKLESRSRKKSRKRMKS